MLDPCLMCTRPECRTRKADCLAPYPNLRAIGNSPGGFRAATDYAFWSPAEVMFYNLQIHHGYGKQTLPDLL